MVRFAEATGAGGGGADDTAGRGGGGGGADVTGGAGGGAEADGIGGGTDTEAGGGTDTGAGGAWRSGYPSVIRAGALIVAVSSWLKEVEGGGTLGLGRARVGGGTDAPAGREER